MNATPENDAAHRIVIAPDSFKSTASSPQAGAYLFEGVMKALEERGVAGQFSVEVFPMADGGEGTASVFEGQKITLPTTDAIGRLTEASYVFDPSTATAYIDVAAASGLPAVADAPAALKADTYGTGVLIADAQTRGATRIVLGLGGSATTDGATGILCALGAQPLDDAGLPLRPGGGELRRIASVDTAQLNIPAAALEWVLLSDVTNPAIGERGTARVFAPQKGASDEEVEQLEQAIATYARVLEIDPTVAGMGAAGAIPVGITWLSRLLHGDDSHVHLLPGARVVADSTGLAEALGRADVLITGEGRFDGQSLGGKVVGTLVDMAAQVRNCGGTDAGVGVFIAAGQVGEDASVPEGAEVVELIDAADVRAQLVDAGYRIAQVVVDRFEPAVS